MKRLIGVLGSGSFGTVITGLLLKNQRPVLVWGRDEQVLRELSKKGKNEKYLPGYELPGRPEVTASIEEVAKRCDLIFCVLPTKAVRNFMSEFGNYAGTHQIMVSCTKGLESENLTRMTEVIKAETPLKKVGALSGPNLAREIAKGVPSSAAIASVLNEVIEDVHQALNSNYFRVFGNYDPIGVEFCGSLKNIYAIASGAAQGLGYGLNATAFLLTKALKEMQYFSLKFNAHKETFSGIAGVGDLIATAMSELSRNFRFGRFISEGKSAEEALSVIQQTVEGYSTVDAVYRFIKASGIRMPIVEAVYNVVYKQVPIQEAVEKLLDIPVMFESEIYV